MYLTIFLIIVLVIYWIVLIIKYDYDKTLPVVYKDEIMDEINPVVAGLIVNKRNVYISDMVAVILNLVKKGVLTLTSVKINEDYLNIVKIKNKSKLKKLDEIEECVFQIVFEDRKEIDFDKRVEELSKDKRLKLNLRKLDRIVKAKLDKIGANGIVVPNILKFTNNLISIITMIYITINICFNSQVIKDFIFSTLNLNINNLSNSIEILIGILILFSGILLYVISIAMRQTFNVRNKIYSFMTNFSDKKIVLVTVTNAILSAILFIVISIILKSNVILEFALFFITVNIVSTDQIMAKHKKSVMKLYCQLCTLRDKIRDYSLIEDKDIEHYVLWESYLVFAIVFNLSQKIILDISKVISKSEYASIMTNVYNNEEMKLVYTIEYLAKDYNQNILSLFLKDKK